MPITIEQQWFKDVLEKTINQSNRLLIFGIGFVTFVLSLMIIVWSVRPGTLGFEEEILKHGSVYMQSDNSYRGGVILTLHGDAFKIIKTNITEKKIQLKKVDHYGDVAEEDKLVSDVGTYKKYTLESSSSPNSNLPKPGVYVTEYGSYDDSEGLIAVSYTENNLEGIKLTGNKHVPAGEKTFIIDTSEDPPVVKMQHANIGFKNARWVTEYKIDFYNQDSFKIKHDSRSSWNCEFYHVSKFDCEVLK